MERCRLLKKDLNLPPSRKPKLCYCLKPQRPKDCRGRACSGELEGAPVLWTYMTFFTVQADHKCNKLSGLRSEEEWHNLEWHSDVTETEISFCDCLGLSNFQMRGNLHHILWREGFGETTCVCGREVTLGQSGSTSHTASRCRLVV